MQIALDYSEIQKAFFVEVLQQAIVLVTLILATAIAASIFVLINILQPLRQLGLRIQKEGHRAGIPARPTTGKQNEVTHLIEISDAYVTALEDKQRELNSALEEARLLARISERTSNGVVVCDPRGRIEWCNPGFTQITGYTLEELKGKTPGSALQGPQSSKTEIDRISKALKKQAPVKAEIINYRKGGKPYWARLDIEPLFDASQNLQHFVAIHIDISQDKERENAMLEARDAAEHLAAAKSNFLATMSHEIRTPMNGIVGMIDLLKETKLDDEQIELLEITNSCSETLLTLINDVLDYSKLDSTGINFEHIEFDPRHEVNQIHQITKKAAHERGLDYLVEIDDNVPETLIGDPTRLNQLLLNLTSNAIKFTNSGSVTIKVKQTRLVEDYHIIEFKVIDTGIGIERETIKELFHPFTQAQSSTTREYGGTGLGLAICKQICDAMATELVVESTPQLGSEFSMALPFGRVGAVSTSLDQPKGGTELNGCVALIVDSNLMQQKILTRQLEEWGCEVAVTSYAEQAIEKAQDWDFDFILMDYDDPEIDGPRTSQTILNIEAAAGQKTPIIPMLSLANPGYESLLEKYEVGAHLTKPTRGPKLVSQVLQHLKSGSGSRPAQWPDSYSI